MLKHTGSQVIEICVAKFDANEPTKPAERVALVIAPGQILTNVAEHFKKHPMWSRLTAANGPLQPAT